MLNSDGKLEGDIDPEDTTPFPGQVTYPSYWSMLKDWVDKYNICFCCLI